MMSALIGKSTAYLLIAAALFTSGLFIGHRRTRDHYQGMIAIKDEAVARAQIKLVQAQAKVITRVEVQYRDRIKVIKEQGDTIIKEVPIYVTPQDNIRF